MLKLQTNIDIAPGTVQITHDSRIMVLGSCFADNVGAFLESAGFDCMTNPFGTLYNPVSVTNAVSRIISGAPFTEDDCVEIGAGSSKICTFSHHTGFSRDTKEEFLQHANDTLSRAANFWKTCDTVIITLGTVRCFRLNATGEIVANCLKHPAAEFTRYALDAASVAAILERLVGRFPDKRFILTVSPIRHLADGAHANQISKSTLLLAEDAVCTAFPDRCVYFPAYELLLDELRDYRFYAEDMVHPSPAAIRYICERFIDFAVPSSEHEKIAAALKQHRRNNHIPNLNRR